MNAILAVEHGWQGMRELSLELARLGVAVEVLIKGRVGRDVLAMITRPAGMRITPVARPWFRWRLLLACLADSRGSSPVYVVTHRRDTPAHERTRQWLERLHRLTPLRILLLDEGVVGRRLLSSQGEEVVLAHEFNKRRVGGLTPGIVR